MASQSASPSDLSTIAIDSNRLVSDVQFQHPPVFAETARGEISTRPNSLELSIYDDDTELGSVPGTSDLGARVFTVGGEVGV